MMKEQTLGFILLTTCLFFTSCGDSPSIVQEEASTWEIIQTEILDKQCVSCHVAGSSFARQSDLVLTADVAYSQLVDRPPHNEAARSDGLVRVGTKGLQSLYNSYLWEKIFFPDFDHFYTDHAEYGELMPIGGPSLTNGELKFISDWIRAGAPRSGTVADISSLEDKERFVIPEEEFKTLTPPTSGIQLKLGPFPVSPTSEREFFYFEPINNAEELFVNRVEVSMRSGSHHFILYDYPEGKEPNKGVFRDFYNEAGNFNFITALSIVDQRFVFGTQWRQTDYRFPEGVALRIKPNAGFDLNSHYVNRTTEAKTGEVSANLHTIPKSEVRYVAENIFENYTDILIPANQTTTLRRESVFNERMNVFQLTSHAHETMTEFKIYIKGGARDGELVYVAKDWEHPPIINFDPPIILEKGHGLRAEATYKNDKNKALRFGLRSEDEMMIIFGAFYRD